MSSTTASLSEGTAAAAEPTWNKEESNADIPKVLQRHYSTIGMEDVFLERPPHLLPSQYLKDVGVRLTAEPFTSWEIVGTIKNSPDDFYVKELFQRNRQIPGLSDADLQKLRVAELIEPDQLPEQRLDKEIPQIEEPGEDTKNSKTAESEENTIVDDPSPVAIIRSHVERLVDGEGNSETTADRIVKSLNSLHESASQRLRRLAFQCEANQTCSAGENPVWIPPLTMDEEGGESSSSKLRQARGDFHRALRTEYPLLFSTSATKDGTDHWIAIKIDDSYDKLIPFLVDPENEIRALLIFQKAGCQDVPERNTTNNRGIGSDDHPKVILTLKPSVTKDERKEIHRILSLGCKSFSTNTLSVDGTAYTSIQVSWFTGSIGRKRKRQNNSRNGISQSTNEYPNVLAVFKKRQWEHLTAIQKLTQAVRCRQSDIGIAGIKDLHAVTYQFCTFRNMKVKRIQNASKELQKYGMELGNLFRVNWVLNNGDLDGNEFALVIRDLRRIRVECADASRTPRESTVECEESHILQMVERLRTGGFINFFGEQRVGSAGSTNDVGVRSFDIGRAMLQQNFSQAVDLLMTGRSGDDSRESDAAKSVRLKWKESGGDPAETLKALKGNDNIMSRERIVLKGLSRYGKDRPLEALRCLSHSMRTFWINAYQSFIWNQVASARIQKYGKAVVKGDLYRDNDEIKVVSSDENSILLSSVVLPLPGHNIRYPENEIGDLYQTLLERDSIKFEKAAPVEARAKGTYRTLVVQPLAVQSEMVLPDAVKLSFQLPKGCYATMCLRELMITTGTR